MTNLALGAAWTQGVYFAALGVWPLIDIGSFQAVTGGKTDHLPTGRETDHWLVNTVGALVAVIGVTLLVSAWRRRISGEIVVLGLLSALALAAIDIVYVVRRTILPIYLADAVIEILLACTWLGCLRGRGTSSPGADAA
jgi:hypothetical protein